MSFLSNLFDPGRKDRRMAAEAAEQGVFRGAGFQGPLGISGYANVINDRVRMGQDLGQFNPIAQMLLSGAKQNLGGGGAADLSFMDSIMSGSMNDLSDPSIAGLDNKSNFAGLGDIFQANMGTATADPFQLGAGVTENLRAQALPGQQRAVNSALSNLFSKGRLGTTGGSNMMGALADSQNMQDLQFQMAGLDAGRGLRSDAMSSIMGATQGREGIAARMFGENAARRGMQGQFAGQRFNMGGSMADLLLQNLLTGQNMGVQSIGAATGLAQLPLAFQSAALQAEGQRSGSHFNRAAILQGNAYMAKSPLLEGIGAIGQFFAPIKLGG